MKLKVGDKIIRCSKVYSVFKIQQKSLAGQKQTIILYRPYFKTKYNQNLVLSIPLNSFSRANIRLPMTKKQLKFLLKELSNKSLKAAPLKIIAAKEILADNDPKKIIDILKSLTGEKSDQQTNFTKSRQEILNLAIKCLVEEVAFVANLSLFQAEKRIKQILKASN